MDKLFFIESAKDLDILSDNLREEDVFLYAVQCSTTAHPCVDSPTVLFVHGMTSGNDFVIAFNHSEADSDIEVGVVADLINAITKKRFVIDKKSFCQLCNICDTIDVNILSYSATSEFLQFDLISTTAHHFYHTMFSKCNVINKIIPIAKHYERFQQIREAAEELLNQTAHDIQFESFSKLNNEIINTLGAIESVGLEVDSELFKKTFGEDTKNLISNNRVYSQYNVYTATGRPSNRFGGVNYAALNKQDDSRSCFISRFGEDGKLIDMDFKAFHPRLIANLVNYDLDVDIDIYGHLAKSFFNTKTPTVEQSAKSKTITFKQFYGGIEYKYRSIPYFKKAQKFIDQQWAFFKKNGYVETPIYNRRLTKDNLGSDANANKVLNYQVQAYETEVGLHAASQILEYLTDKKTKVVLYTYDSILLDFHKDDGKETLLEIRKIMLAGGKFPIKVKVGDNYKHMSEMTL